MDDIANKLAKELAAAIAAAVASDPRVEDCHRRAGESGFKMELQLEAVVGFANRVAVERPRVPSVPASAGIHASAPSGLSHNDRAFLQKLRIAADEVQEKEVE